MKLKSRRPQPLLKPRSAQKAIELPRILDRMCWCRPRWMKGSNGCRRPSPIAVT